MYFFGFPIVFVVLSLFAIIVQCWSGCAEGCLSNDDGVNCAPNQWPCLCTSQLYIDRLRACTVAFCNMTLAQQETFDIVPELCGLFGASPTAAPEASFASIMTTEATPTVASCEPPLDVTFLTPIITAVETLGDAVASLSQRITSLAWTGMLPWNGTESSTFTSFGTYAVTCTTKRGSTSSTASGPSTSMAVFTGDGPGKASIRQSCLVTALILLLSPLMKAS